jgi:hypothetical protein
MYMRVNVTGASLATGILLGAAWVLYGIKWHTVVRKHRFTQYNRKSFVQQSANAPSRTSDKNSLGFHTRSGSKLRVHKTVDNSQCDPGQPMRFKIKSFFISPLATMSIGGSFVVTNIALAACLWDTRYRVTPSTGSQTCSNTTIAAACSLLISFFITQIRPVNAYASVVFRTITTSKRVPSPSDVRRRVWYANSATGTFFVLLWMSFVCLFSVHCACSEGQRALLQLEKNATVSGNLCVVQGDTATPGVAVYVWVLSLVFLSIALRLAHLHWESSPLLQKNATTKWSKLQAIYSVVPPQIIVVFVWVNVTICWVTSSALSLVLVVWKYGRFENGWSHGVLSQGLVAETTVELVELISIASVFTFAVATFVLLILPSMLVAEKTLQTQRC